MTESPQITVENCLPIHAFYAITNTFITAAFGVIIWCGSKSGTEL